MLGTKQKFSLSSSLTHFAESGGLFDVLGLQS